MEIPKAVFRGNFGIYIHVPFCYSVCSFCPFYKEIFSEDLKGQYLEAILKEIDNTDMQGKAKWIYFGGGTPNTLTTKDLSNIVERIRRKVQIDSMGIELLPTILKSDYLKGLKDIGFTKISVGVESFSNKVASKTGRKIAKNEEIEKIVNLSRTLGLGTNVDMMVGLPDQNPDTFREDIKNINALRPDQVTIYPFMILKGVNARPSIPSYEQFRLIEEANEILRGSGYSRKNVWAFAIYDDLYDSSGDELIEDYIGFGPGAFSTYGDSKIVNPELDVYVKNYRRGKNMKFIAYKSKASDEWRKFAKMIYELKCDNHKNHLASYIKLFMWILKITGYSSQGMLTEKGIIFAHEITKAVVESLPLPIRNHNCIENYDEYFAYKKEK
jgi:oxygen-independent coproporphyrinogen-3 oxidase